METNTPATPTSEKDTRPIAVAILAATTTELMPTARALNLASAGPSVFLGIGESARVVAVVTGIGPTNAAAALIRLMDRERIGSIVNIGFVGGLERSLKTGDLMDIRWILSPSDVPLWIGDGVPVVARNLSQRTPQRSLLSVDRVAESPQVKRRLYETHLAATVDMESYELAKVASQLKLPYRAVRAITDPWDATLPHEAERWVTPDGKPDWRAVLKDVAKRPALLKAVMELRKSAKIASQALVDKTRQVVGDEARALQRFKVE